jgi:hypothetical protein
MGPDRAWRSGPHCKNRADERHHYKGFIRVCSATRGRQWALNFAVVNPVQSARERQAIARVQFLYIGAVRPWRGTTRVGDHK